jgi:hypothetical protein
MTRDNKAADPSQKVNTEPHVGQVAKPEVYIDDGGARFFLEKLRGSLQHLGKISQGGFSRLLARHDAYDGNKRTLQNCGQSPKCCQGSVCQDMLIALTAGAAVGAVSQCLPGCDTSCRLDT